MQTFRVMRACGTPASITVHQIIDRVFIFQRDLIRNCYERKCQKCGDDKTLQVHHIDKNRDNNQLSNLILLCGHCHAKEHNKKSLGVFALVCLKMPDEPMPVEKFMKENKHRLLFQYV